MGMGAYGCTHIKNVTKRSIILLITDMLKKVQKKRQINIINIVMILINMTNEIVSIRFIFLLLLKTPLPTQESRDVQWAH